MWAFGVVGLLAGAAIGFAVADRVTPKTFGWRVVQATVPAPRHDPDCFPDVSIPSPDDRAAILDRIDMLRSELPQEEIAILRTQLVPIQGLPTSTWMEPDGSHVSSRPRSS